MPPIMPKADPECQGIYGDLFVLFVQSVAGNVLTHGADFFTVHSWTTATKTEAGR
jgi:hypothetical protein